MIRLKNMPHMLWIAGLALIAACSDGGGEERPGPQQTALSIVWTPEAPAAGQSVRFSLGGDVSNVRSVLCSATARPLRRQPAERSTMPMPLPETTR